MGKDDLHSVTLSVGAEAEMGNDLEYLDRPRTIMRGTKADSRDMSRMGKRQEFNRNFTFLSIVGYSIVAMSTWQAQLATNLTGLADAGLSNVLYGYLLVFILWCFVVASMAEMAAMAPTSGGQYHWVAEFAPRRVSRPLSYVTGWSSTLAWQCTFVSFCSNVPQDIQSLLILTGSNVKVYPWQTSFILIAIAAIAVLANTNVGNSLPIIGGVFILFYFCIFLAVLTILWVLGPRNDAAQVFVSFSTRGDPRGLGYILAFSTFHPVFSLMAPDAAIHMAEEVRDSSLVLPRAIMTSTILNGLLGLLMLITFCFTIGDVKTVLSSGITIHLDILFNATHSTAVTLFLSIIIDLVGAATCICALTSASRQLFAFARDGGVPFSSFLATIRPGWNVPLNAMLASFGFTVVVSLIMMGWDRMQGIVVGLTVLANLFAYLVSITCLRLKRWRNEPLPRQRWSLGRWGGPINDVAIIFIAYLLITNSIAYPIHVNASSMNYNGVVCAGVLLLSIAFYYVRGRKVYTSPAALIRSNI